MIGSQKEQLEQELRNWREAYECLRQAMKLTFLSKMVPQDKRDGFLLQLDLLSHDAQDLGDLLEQRIENQKTKRNSSR